MQTTQQKHVIPIKKPSRPLFGSGVDKSLAYIIGDDFVFKAKKDGIIERIDEKNEVAIIKYNDGTKDAIDLSAIMSKNSNGGLSEVHLKLL